METKWEKYLRFEDQKRKRQSDKLKKYMKYKLGDIVIYDHPYDGSTYPKKYEIVASKLNRRNHQFVKLKNVETGKYLNNLFKNDINSIQEKYLWIDIDHIKTEVEYHAGKYNL